MRALRDVAVQRRMRMLFVQPPREARDLTCRLPAWGYAPWPVEVAPSATVLLDLRPDLDELLGRMSKSTRKGIRKSSRSGIQIREATVDDLPGFHRLLQMTGQRRGFTPYPLDYFQNMWRILAPRGYLKLFLSEYAGEAVSAQIVVPFRDRVIAKQIGWSGHHGERQPNTALDWATIQWAKARGYTWYDLEGIEPDVARGLLKGRPLPGALAETATAYKLRLGGDVVMCPGAHCFFPNPVLRAVYKGPGRWFASRGLIQRAALRFRTRGA
jgi:hypothetical protein